MLNFGTFDGTKLISTQEFNMGDKTGLVKTSTTLTNANETDQVESESVAGSPEKPILTLHLTRAK
jgi:hypothetical protein